jgi:hypothetical protein
MLPPINASVLDCFVVQWMLTGRVSLGVTASGSLIALRELALIVIL